MKSINDIQNQSKTEIYRIMAKQLDALLEGEKNLVANLANTAAIIWQGLNDINWAGFYLKDGDELVLAPFQGKIACVRIPIGAGVCGTAAMNDEILLVDNVHEFDGHIACDSASNSEIVLPIHYDGKVVAVLDIDSPIFSRFDDKDKQGLFEIVKIIEKHI